MILLFRNYYTIRNSFLIVLESLLLYLCIILSASYFFKGVGGGYTSIHSKAVCIVAVCVICLYCNNAYCIKDTRGYVDLTIKLLQSFGSALIFLSLFYLIFSEAIIIKGFFFIFIPLVLALFSVWRFVYVFILKSGVFNQNIFVLGDSTLLFEICREIERAIDCGYCVKGILTEGNIAELKSLKSKYVGGYEGVAETAAAFGVKRIVVALNEKRGNFPVDELLMCRVNGIDVIEGHTFYEMLTGKFLVSSINPSWLIFSNGFRKSRLRNILKRIEDIVASVVLLTLFSPVILAVAILIKLDSKGPVMFCQERLGLHQKGYNLYKFRSMVVDAEKDSGPVWAKKNDARVTRIGSFIRKWRIDELPQLFNVLKGDMSLVGPRPERAHFVRQLEVVLPYYSERFTVRPGVTGWAQVRYEYGDSVEDAMEKLNYDLFYIKNMSILMDIVIAFRTVRTVLFGVGAR
ncbi:hypothetical protein DSLASN_27370 [Desulfoluna limicola]|uniref:Bacterial sugar transferase domain-containing protein n=1 Tax=Desulfoluna limicola TaxID=2810562 RepID=A0ABM7PIW8_9BACT|nr:TIGR03013 family XrtA/PEP-CTERM system glycosyltransferase [Desulfoluna limicola]BCS97105.1 hypothetical protein DSLASN_27370 [Desulfoluna limicola]